MKEIKSTTNYEMFKKLEGNRATTVARVNKIKKSIMTVGYITSPILVNENMEIIDGQGRFEALKELRLPVEYIVQKGLNVKECIAMNIYQTNWKVIDYIKSYAAKGNPDYLRLTSLMTEFPLVATTEIMAIALFELGRFDPLKVREGNLEISEEQYEEAREKLKFIYPIAKEYKSITRIRLILNAMLYCLYIPGIDKYRLKTKVISILETGKIPPIPTVDEAMQLMEEIYNRNSKRETFYIYTEYRKRSEERERRGLDVLKKKQKDFYKYVETKEEEN